MQPLLRTRSPVANAGRVHYNKGVDSCLRRHPIAYHVTLRAFDGPLDLLLRLAARAQVDIRDIFIADITEQFLRFVGGMQPDMERAGEFLEMAARLLEMKSRRLLPGAQEDLELEQMGEELVAQLEEYRRFKWASLELRGRESLGAAFYYRLPEEYVQGELEVDTAGAMALYRAFFALMARAGAPGEEKTGGDSEIERDSFTVQQQILMIRHRILRQGKCLFSSLFEQSVTKQAVITAFMAVLELMKLGEITVHQQGLYADMVMIPKEKREAQNALG